MKPTPLTEHPEGGRFREVFRSVRRVTRDDGATRRALTHIYFALEPGEVSRFHRVDADEIWNLYAGSGLVLYVWDGSERAPQRHLLSGASGNHCQVVPSGCWQAAEPLADATLVGCSVGPGFEFEDFELMEPQSDVARRLLATDPSLDRFVVR